MATDQFNVTGAVSPANPKTGDQLTVTIAGGNTHTDAGAVGPLTLSVTASGGATTTVNVPSLPYTVVTQQGVHITSVTDPSGRVWTVTGDGKSATATA